MTESTSNRTLAAYAAHRYRSYAYPASAPENLQAILLLHGLDAAPSASARVLELGCASGGNLLPFALRNPHSRCVGIDLDASAINVARTAAKRGALHNIEFHAVDLVDLQPDALGRFDYIVAHGLYSWIPPAVRETLIRCVAALLTDTGALFLSYNTYPGWKFKEPVRDAMLLHGEAGSADELVARGKAMLAFLARTCVKGTGMHRAVLDNIDVVQRTGDDYLAHDYLEPDNWPRYFAEVAGELDALGLHFIDEAQPSMSTPDRYRAGLGALLESSLGGDRIRSQQYLDHVVGRSFRQSVFARQVPVGSRGGPSLRGLHHAAPLTADKLPDGTACFTHDAKLVLRTRDPVARRVCEMLAARWPATVSFDELSQAAGGEALPEHQVIAVLTHLLDHGHLRIRAAPMYAVGIAAAQVSREVRLAYAMRTEEDATATTAWHDTVDLTPQDVAVLGSTDGRRAGDAAAEAILAARFRVLGLTATMEPEA